MPLTCFLEQQNRVETNTLKTHFAWVIQVFFPEIPARTIFAFEAEKIK